MVGILRGQIAIEAGFRVATRYGPFYAGGEAALKRGAQAINATAPAEVVGLRGARVTIVDAAHQGSKQERPLEGRRRSCRAR